MTFPDLKSIYEWPLDQLREVSPELGPGGLDANGLINIGANVATNYAQSLTVEKIMNEYSDASPVKVASGEDDGDDNDDMATPQHQLHPVPRTPYLFAILIRQSKR